MAIKHILLALALFGCGVIDDVIDELQPGVEIGVEGGAVYVGDVSVVIPPGALGGTLLVDAQTVVAETPTNVDVLSVVLAISPDSTTTSSPFTILMPLMQGHEGDCTLYRTDPRAGSRFWQPVVQVTPIDGYGVAEVTRFGIYFFGVERPGRDAGFFDVIPVDSTPSMDSSAPDAGGPDAPGVDAGPVDAGPVDAGPIDAGPVDAGPGTDATPAGPDAGPSAPDSGPSDL